MKWIRFADHPEVPPDAKVVAFARSSKCQTGELCGKPIISVIQRPTNGWSPVIGWELFFVVPSELHWIAQLNFR